MTCFYIVASILTRDCNFPFDRLLGMLRAGMFLHLKQLVRYLPLALIDLVNEFQKKVWKSKPDVIRSLQFDLIVVLVLKIIWLKLATCLLKATP